MKLSIFSYLPLQPDDNTAEICQTDTDDQHGDEVFSQLQQDDHRIAAWSGSREPEQKEGDQAQ